MKKIKKFYFRIVAILILVTFATNTSMVKNTILPFINDAKETINCYGKPENIPPGLNIHFIDVGQGDATLITCNGEAMLIDAGDNSCGTLVQNYIKKQGVKELKYLIATHPDADHIGGVDVIINKFDIDTFIMPSVKKDTKTYNDVIEAARYKNLKILPPTIGTQFILGGATFEVLGPNESKKYDNVNNYSVVILMEYQDIKILFSGDAEEPEERYIISENPNISADIIKIGHHGSRTSTSQEYLNIVNPKFAVISVGENNDYGHPHADSLNRLRQANVEVRRTDEQGSIICTISKNSIQWNCPPSLSWQAGE